jgi:hypothetical protein
VNANKTQGEGQGGRVNRGRCQKRKAGIASIRLFVDPRPAEGLYAALGMGWAAGSASASPVGSPVASPLFSPVASPVGSPMASPTASTFASAGHAYASQTVRTFGEATEGVVEAAASSSFAGFAGAFGRRGHQELERCARMRMRKRYGRRQRDDACLRSAD